MRRGALTILLLSTLGCHCHNKSAPATQPMTVLEDSFYETSHASALAFSPPIVQDDPPLELSRADREPAAFVGYEDLIRSYIYIRTDDRWTADGNDRYERRAIIEQIGSSTR